MNTYNFPTPSNLKKTLESGLTVPTIFKNHFKCWKRVPESNDEFIKKYGNISLDFRIVPNSLKGIAWEENATYIKGTISDFSDWQCGKNETNLNPFSKFLKEDYWAYSSYNYMNLIFGEEIEILQDINWSTFGFPNISNKDCTFWLGSKGANTPCHVDSYGFNIIAQFFGKKKWILFPPSDTKCLYPTRIPYEESSIFSFVNVLEPDFQQHPNFKESHPYVVMLDKGDILCVPKGWWHFVYSLDDFTMSINTWIKLETDCDSRLTESVARTLMTALIPMIEPDDEDWLNPKEELVSADETLNYVVAALNILKKDKETNVHEANEKILKTQKDSDVHSEEYKNSIYDCKDIIKVKPISVMDLYENLKTKNNSALNNDTNLTIKNIVNCFVHPDVVNLISQLLKEI